MILCISVLSVVISPFSFLILLIWFFSLCFLMSLANGLSILFFYFLFFLFGRKILGKHTRHSLMVQVIWITRNSEVYVAELNHLKKKMRRLEEGQRPRTSGKEIFCQSPQVAEMVLSKGCKAHLLFWFSVSITVQILHFKKLCPVWDYCAGKWTSMHQMF